MRSDRRATWTSGEPVSGRVRLELRDGLGFANGRSRAYRLQSRQRPRRDDPSRGRGGQWGISRSASSAALSLEPVSPESRRPLRPIQRSPDVGRHRPRHCRCSARHRRLHRWSRRPHHRPTRCPPRSEVWRRCPRRHHLRFQRTSLSRRRSRSSSRTPPVPPRTPSIASPPTPPQPPPPAPSFAETFWPCPPLHPPPGHCPEIVVRPPMPGVLDPAPAGPPPPPLPPVPPGYQELVAFRDEFPESPP